MRKILISTIFLFSALPMINLRAEDKMFRISTDNTGLMPNRQSSQSFHDRVYSGDYLMKVGLPALGPAHLSSTVLELTAE